MDNEDMLQADSLPATKGDLKAFATKIDLKRFATKDDLSNELKRFATKDDLERFATKDDVSKGLSKLEVRMDAKLDFWAQKIEAANERFRSDMLGHAEKFATRTQRVERDETILIHRVDELEKRVSSLESDPKRPS